MRRLYTNISIESIAVQQESQLLDGSITNAPLTVNTVGVDSFDTGTGATFYFDENRIEY